MKLYIIINIVSLILLIVSYRKNFTYISFFNFFLFAVIFEVFIANWYKQRHETNHIPYCYFALICAIFYIIIYRYKINKLFEFINLGIIISGIILLYIFFGENQFIFLNKIYLILISEAAILGVRYLYLKLKKEFNYNSFIYDPYLYFTFGLLIFYTTSFPLLLFLETLIASGELLKTYSSILKIGNIFLSLGYLGAAICIRKEAQSIG